jgi:hypothetical protein
LSEPRQQQATTAGALVIVVLGEDDTHKSNHRSARRRRRRRTTTTTVVVNKTLGIVLLSIAFSKVVGALLHSVSQHPVQQVHTTSDAQSDSKLDHKNESSQKIGSRLPVKSLASVQTERWQGNVSERDNVHAKKTHQSTYGDTTQSTMSVLRVHLEWNP